MRQRPSCGRILPSAWQQRFASIHRMCACAASRCGCSGHPSAQWMRSACILCSRTFRLWMFRRILPLRMTLPWCACSRKPFPPCWNRHIPILTSVPLRTCMTAAGRMIPQAGRCRNCITLPRRCHTRRRRCSALLKCGRAMPHRKRPSGGRPFCGKPLRGSRAYCAFCARRKKLQRRTRRRIKP